MGGEHRLQAIRAQLMSVEPATKTQEVLHSELLRYLDAMTVQREQRLASVTAASPNLRWPRKPGDIGFGRRACGGCGRQAVLNHVAELRTLNPALGRLRPRDMIKTPRYD